MIEIARKAGRGCGCGAVRAETVQGECWEFPGKDIPTTIPRGAGWLSYVTLLSVFHPVGPPRAPELWK
jgi:hypothetical protein